MVEDFNGRSKFVEGIELSLSESATAGFEFDRELGVSGIPKPILLRQVHGSVGHRVDASTRECLEGDWLWTTDPKVCVGVLVADCTAILVAGQRSGGEYFWAAIHAGWRGTAARIIDRAFEELKPSSFMAWLSPSICQEHFEVGGEVIESLGGECKAHTRQLPSKKFLLDLKGLQISQIKKFGGDIRYSSLCTWCQPEFVSYRESHGKLSRRHLAWISHSSSTPSS